MSRKDDANRRAFYRWEFIRRNKDYQKAYNELAKNKIELIDLDAISEKTKIEFIRKFFVYPLNPNFSYDQIVDEYKRLVGSRQVYNDKIKNIYRKYLGKNWAEINRNLFWHKNKCLRHEEKFDFKKYIPARDKAKEAIKRLGSAQDMDQIFVKRGYLNEALQRLSAIKLSPVVADSDSKTTVINSFLKDNPNIEVFGVEYGFRYVSLVNSSIADFDSNPMIDSFSGDLAKICFTVDLSYPTNDIVADLKKEISKWKTVRRKYNKDEKKRQNLYIDGVKKMLQVYDLREVKRLTYNQIANDSNPHAIQKTRNMFKKAKRYIEGEYKQIR